MLSVNVREYSGTADADVTVLFPGTMRDNTVLCEWWEKSVLISWWSGVGV